ncbi:MAG: site-specific integrase [Actinomycetota bacterium]|nr:site-specific integrase [Actinomycetota bacterium]
MSRRRGNGEGTITRRKDGRWEARYVVHTDRGARRRVLYGKTRKEVADKLVKTLADRADGLVYEDENTTLGDYLDAWLKGSVRGSVRESTFDRYEIAVRVHIKPALGRFKLKKLTPAHVQGFYRDRLDAGFAPASVNKLHVVLHKALKQAVEWHMVPRNVAGLARAPRSSATKEISPLSAEEARRLLDAARGNRLEALYMLALHTGMRQGELLALKWQDVDLENATLSIRRTLTRSGGRLLLGEPKTRKSRRTIDLTEASVGALREHLARQTEEITILGDRYGDAGLVFTSEAGTIINPTNLRRRSFASLLERARVPRVRFHDLRHTCATLLFSRNVHPKDVQELLGHSNISITLDTYSHVIPATRDRAARAMEDALS